MSVTFHIDSPDTWCMQKYPRIADADTSVANSHFQSTPNGERETVIPSLTEKMG